MKRCIKYKEYERGWIVLSGYNAHARDDIDRLLGSLILNKFLNLLYITGVHTQQFTVLSIFRMALARFCANKETYRHCVPCTDFAFSTSVTSN